MQKIEARLSNAIDFGTIGALNAIPGAVPTTMDGMAVMTGDDWGYGYTVGFLYEPARNQRIGVSYRSRVSHSLKGTTELEVPC